MLLYDYHNYTYFVTFNFYKSSTELFYWFYLTRFLKQTLCKDIVTKIYILQYQHIYIMYCKQV